MQQAQGVAVSQYLGSLTETNSIRVCASHTGAPAILHPASPANAAGAHACTCMHSAYDCTASIHATFHVHLLHMHGCEM